MCILLCILHGENKPYINIVHTLLLQGPETTGIYFTNLILLNWYLPDYEAFELRMKTSFSQNENMSIILKFWLVNPHMLIYISSRFFHLY